MRTLHGFAAVLVALAGCRSPDSPDLVRTQATSEKAGGLQSITRSDNPNPTPTNAVEALPLVLPTSGRVHAVNDHAHFIVIDYTLGGLPPPQSELSVYRNGEKVGSVRISGPAMYGFATADIEEGFIQIDDEVRIR